MDPTNEEILRLLKELIDSTDRRLAARYDRMIETIDSCLTTGGTAPSSSTSAGSDVYGVADVPTPASLNPIAEVPTPASSDSDAKLITIDVDVPAAPTRTTRLTGDPSCDSGSAPAPLTAPTVHTATADIVPVLAAPAATDRALDGQAISGVPATPASCLIVCLPRHPVAAPVVVASSTPATPECVLDTNSTLVEVVPLPTKGEFPAVLTSTAFTFMFQMEQLYSGRKIFMPTYCQLIASKVPRPMPWPSLMGVHVDGVEARPLPWPSFRKINSCEFPSDVVAKASHPESCASIEFQISEFCGNLKGDQFLNDADEKACWLCNPDRSHAEVCVATTFNFSDFCVMIRSLELKVLSIGLTAVNSPTVLLDSGIFALNFEYLGVHTTVCIGPWLLVGCLRVCWKYSVQSATHYSLASACVTQLLRTMNCSQLKMLVTAAGHSMRVAGFPKRQMSSHMLLLSWVWEQEELYLGFQFQLHIILPAWYLGNQSVIARMCPDYSLKYNSFAHIWRLWVLCVRSVCAIVDAVVLPDGQHSRNWHSAQPRVARDALLFIIQTTVLNYMEYWWVRTVILTDIVSIFSAWIPVQMEVPHMQQLSWFSFSVFNVYNTLLSKSVITESQQANLLNCYQVYTIHPVAMLALQGSTDNLCASGTCQVCKIPRYMKYFYSGHYQMETYFHDGHLSYRVIKHNVPHASRCSGEEHLLESFLKQECGDVSFNSSFHICTRMRMTKSEGSGELSQWLANNLWGPYIWLVAWTVDVFELPTNCGQAPFQGGREVIRAAFPNQVHFSHDYYMAFINQISADSYNYLNQALYFDTVGTHLIYYHEGSRGDSSKSRELHVPWDPGKLVLRYQRKLRLEVKPCFKEGGVSGPFLYLSMGLGLASAGAVVMGLGLPIGNNDKTYKYQATQGGNHPDGSRTGGLFFSYLRLSLSSCTFSSLNPNPPCCYTCISDCVIFVS